MCTLGNFNELREKLLTKTNQKCDIFKRTCHFFTYKNRRRVLYFALVRSHSLSIERQCGGQVVAP